ncbi:MAG: hypothetical protein OEV91_11370, partial [Desulfobulbaceae bacterium]|nr:hypothetical protein [Desulfobulbaceae bacterium]
MRKLTLDEVKAGMVVAADIFDQDFGGELPIIGRGVELSATFINRLKERGIQDLLIITPAGYRGAPGETLAPTEVKGNILFDGAIELACDVPPATRIEGGETVSITGNVAAGCNIISATGDIVINGSLRGEAGKHIILSAAHRITIKNTS